jgi:hypothetical protein
MMTVARRNRVWTPELAAKLVNAVNKKMKNGYRVTEAFRELSPEWGAAEGTISGVYYKHRFKALPTVTVARKKVKGTPQPMHTPSVQQAINILRGMGFNITLTI